MMKIINDNIYNNKYYLNLNKKSFDFSNSLNFEGSLKEKDNSIPNSKIISRNFINNKLESYTSMGNNLNIEKRIIENNHENYTKNLFVNEDLFTTNQKIAEILKAIKEYKEKIEENLILGDEKEKEEKKQKAKMNNLSLKEKKEVELNEKLGIETYFPGKEKNKQLFLNITFEDEEEKKKHKDDLNAFI